jgi:opacity protein-like surface antigen
MKYHWWTRIVAVAAGCLVSTGVLAQGESDRAGKVDSSFILGHIASESISGSQGATADIDSATAWGINIAYNFTNRWALGLDFTASDPDYTVHTTPAAGNPGPGFERTGDLRVSTTNLTGTYYFSPSHLAPFVNASIGRTWVDTNIPAGPPTNVCWYDPWWGYYCGPTIPTKSDSYWGYGAGVGLRWDSQGPFFVRALVNQQWLDVGGNVGTPSFTQYRLDLGARF